MSGIILGPGLIGEAASKKAQATAVDDAGGGAIQLGAKLKNNKKFGQAAVAEKAAAIRAAAAPAPAPEPEPAFPEIDLATPLSAPPAPGTGLSEDDIELMLATDPNCWDVVAEAEGKRVEGWRPRVARMLLNAGTETKKTKPMEQAIVDALTKIAEVGAVAEAKKLTEAVGAAPSIGTGDPDAPAK